MILRKLVASTNLWLGSVHVAMPGSVHGTFIELPQHDIHIPPRPLSFRRYKSTRVRLRPDGRGRSVLVATPYIVASSSFLGLLSRRRPRLRLEEGGSAQV